MLNLLTQVCRKFHDVGAKMLSRGFVRIEKRHSTIYKKFKAMLPRRESERKSHPLARHCDILSAVETRISMLNMTFMKYIDSNTACFIPGKVLDEIESILNLVESGVPPPRTHELLQELRDISSMAMEHFDEHILPRAKMLMTQMPVIPLSPAANISQLVLIQSTLIRKIKKRNTIQTQQLNLMKQQIQKLSRKVKRQNLRLKSQNAKIRGQEKIIQNQQHKLHEQESTLADLKKQIDEWDQKFADLTAELVRAREDAIKPLPTSAKHSFPFIDSAVPRIYKTNIKPRVAHILPPQFVTELDRKRKASFTSDLPSKLSKVIEDKEKITNLINANITNNISKSITDKYDGKLQNEKKSLFKGGDFSSFISNSIETLLQNPLTSIKSRKRKINDES